MKKRILTLIPLCFILTACSPLSSTTTKVEKTTTSLIEESKIVLDSNIVVKKCDFSTRKIEKKEDVTYQDLFNLGNQVSISIDISNEELELLQRDLDYYVNTGCKMETYHRLNSVTITLKNYDNVFSWTLDDVGIRQKGNTSRKAEWPIYANGAVASLNHFKLSFDETFDDSKMYGDKAIDWTGKEKELKARKDRDFLGLSGLDLKWNKNYDATHIKEIYANRLYNSLGLISQYTGLSNFEINQVDNNKKYDMGVYTIYEPAKKSLIKRNLEDGDILNFSSWSEEKKGTYGVEKSKYGDLYKCSWGVDFTYSNINNNVGVGSYDGTYLPKYERKTNTDIEYDDKLLKNFGSAIQSRDYNKISNVLDLEYFAATEAVNYFIGNPDDLKNNTNNVMIYFRKTDGKAITIPIDNDRCFGITKDWNPGGKAMMNIGVLDDKKSEGGNVINLYTDTILKNNSEAKKMYLSYVKALYDSEWLTDAKFNELYNIALRSYGDTVSSVYQYVNFSLKDTNASFSEYITAKKNLAKIYID